MASEPDQHSTPASFYESPQAARHARPEEFLYLACMHEGTGVDEPDFLAVVDAQDGRVVHETPMPNVGDELHHFGWNRCSSACHGPDRSHLIVPGFRSSRIHVLNVADDPRRPRIEKVIEPRELVDKTGYTRPHTVHCMPGDNVVVSMLGDRDGGGAGGFAVLDARTFEVKGRWENGGALPPFNYDFWYQPRQNVLASSEFGEPNAYEKGFDIDDVAAGRYGSRLHFWNLAERRVEQTLELGEAGLLPFEVRWLHDPDADEGFVGAALSSTMWHFRRDNGSFTADPVIAVENVELDGWPLPGGVPSVITDLLVSMDDRFLYFTNWLHGDLRQYDISDPANPRLTGRLWLGGLLGKPNDAGRDLHGGPQEERGERRERERREPEEKGGGGANRVAGGATQDAPCPRRGSRTARQIQAARPQPGPAAKRHNIRVAHSRREGAEPATPARPLPRCTRAAGAATGPLSPSIARSRHVGVSSSARAAASRASRSAWRACPSSASMTCAFVLRCSGPPCRRRDPTIRRTYAALSSVSRARHSKRPVASRSRSYRLLSGNGGNEDSRRTIQLS